MAIYGCLMCGEYTNLAGTYVVCTACQYGLFLLSNGTLSTNYPPNYSYCVHDCRLAHASYINNMITGSCAWCG